MPSLSELRKKIKGISSTRQITKAMKMVAGARFGRAGRQRSDAVYYQTELEKAIFAFLSTGGPPQGKLARLYSIATTEKAAAPQGNVGLLVIAADKGLCGGLNTNVLRMALAISTTPSCAKPMGSRERTGNASRCCSP